MPSNVLPRKVLYGKSPTPFYDSQRDIHGDTRRKTRCTGDYLWFYKGKEDKNGVRIECSLGIDKEELDDLVARGVKRYECRFKGGRILWLEISEIVKLACPVVNRDVDREQICVHWHLWHDNDEGETMPKRRRKKKKEVSIWDKVTPLPHFDSSKQYSLFGEPK